MKNTRLLKSKFYRHLGAWLSLLIILSLMLPFTRAQAVAGQVDANNVTSAPTIDGNLNEAGWSLANSASKTTIGAPNNTVTFGAMWDATNLYIAVKVLDGNLFNDSANTWEDDSVEVYIDANHNLGTTYDSFDRQFVKGYNDTALTGIGSQAGVQHAWAAVAGGYSTEMAIPWSNLGVSPASGLTIGFDVGYNDDDNAGTRESQAVWWGSLNNYNNTSAFGNLVLMGGASTPTRTLTAVSGTTNTKTVTPAPSRSSTPTLTLGASPTATLTGGQSAYPSGVAWAIPGTIQAENFDLGGETVAYHDSDAANTGAQYRTSDGVDIEATTDTGGGQNVGWTRTDEWLEYTVNVATAGNYTLTERVASGVTTGSFRVEFNGVNKTGTVAIPNTGGWQTWQSISQTVNLSAGIQVMRVYFLGNDSNLNYLTLTAANTPTVTPAPSRSSTPTATSIGGQSAYPAGVAWAVPGTIQAENFDLGGETIAYHDNETLNQGSQYRTSDGVDIEASTDTGGGYSVGWTLANEWLEYTINVPSAGNYTLTERIASTNGTSSFRVEFNGIDKTGTVVVPNTGGWQTWQSISQTVNLSAGVQVMRIYIVTEGFNINYVSLTPASGATPTATPPTGWNLVWNDEFNGSGAINTNDWNFDLGGGGWGNGELETYTNSTANVYQDGGGNLVIKSINNNGSYTSGRIHTANKHAFTYGRFEMRAKLPYGQGIWPAFWLLGSTGGAWPNNGEIDIMENIGKASEQNIIHGTIHGPGYSGANGISGAYTGPRFADAFHTFAVEWEPNAIRWYVDGNLYQTLTPASIPAGTQWVYNHDFFIILNSAIGGGWPGNPDGSTVFPQSYTIDYVRVYSTSTPGTGFSSIVSNAQFDQMFPNRNAFYTYQGLVTAANFYPAFAGTGSLDTKKREAAAALANFNHETGGLFYITEIAKNTYCDPNNTQYPCAAGKQYYGRGPIQISWNFNYGAAGTALGLPLLSNPDLVEQDPAVAWKTALWYWMTQTGAGTMTSHNAMVNGAGFGETIRTINGSLECNGGNPAQVQSRIDAYNNFIGILGTTAGPGNISC